MRFAPNNLRDKGRPSLDFHSARKYLTCALRSISAHAHGCAWRTPLR
jgi:hypothetical protein